MKKQIINWYNLPARIHSLFLTKQDKLTAGSNIQIEDNVISVTGGGGGGSELMIEITHADLLALVNSSALTKGQQYRITDYVATVDTDVYSNARSNNHTFDIIVVADSENKLNENARAIRHNGDTYFPSHVKFESWQLKYTILNDSERFDWALSSGKGVVYQLIDEWNNDVSYDFKSIQFQRDDVWFYTFGGASDASLEVHYCFEDKIYSTYTYVNNYVYCLNNNIFGNSCYSNTFGNNCKSNIIGSNCRLNIFGNSCDSNTFGNNCYSNTFGDNCDSNNFVFEFYSNTFGDNCRSNTFGNNCYSNTFGDGCRSNTFGDGCYSNTFGDGCYSNTFGDECSGNTFGNDCSNLTIGSNPPCRFNVGNNVSNINLSAQLSNFTTPPDGNTVEVYRTVNGIAFRQEVSAGVVETFDVV